MVACLISVKILMTVFSFASFWVDFDLFEFTNTSDISSRTEVLALTRVTRTSQHVASVSLAFPVGRSGSVFSWRNSEVSCCSVAQSCLTLYTPVVCSTPGFPVLHHLLELAQTHVPWGSDAIQPSHPLSSPSPPASVFPSIRVFSQLFASGGQSIGASASSSVLPVNI